MCGVDQRIACRSSTTASEWQQPLRESADSVARLFRAFHYPGDTLGKYRLDAEYTWCLTYTMLEVLGPDAVLSALRDQRSG